jgi:hypothetical protein
MAPSLLCFPHALAPRRSELVAQQIDKGLVGLICVVGHGHYLKKRVGDACGLVGNAVAQRSPPHQPRPTF